MYVLYFKYKLLSNLIGFVNETKLFKLIQKMKT